MNGDRRDYEGLRGGDGEHQALNLAFPEPDMPGRHPGGRGSDARSYVISIRAGWELQMKADE